MSGALAFLAGLGTGYLNEGNRQKKQKDDDEDRALRNEASRLQIDEAKANAADKKTLRLAGAPVALTEGAGGMLKPEAMDNRDVGLPENASLPNAGLQEGGFNVAGKSFADRGMANAAVEAANTPQAVGKRTAAALYGMGKPGEAMQLEASAKQAEMADLTLANAKWRSDLGAAMTGGHDKMAELVTKTEVGILKGQKAQVIRKGDGMVSYGTVDKDGKVTPVPGLTFPDTQDGIAMAGFMLDREITPKDRIDYVRQGKKDEQAQSNFNLTHNLAVSTKDEIRRHNMAQEGLAGQRLAGAGGGGGGGGGSGGKGGTTGETAPYNPLGDFQMKEAQVESIKQAAQAARESAATDKPMSPADQGRLQQKIYRGMADAHAAEATSRQRASVFTTNARQAKTPEEIEAVRQRATQSGYSPQEMAQLDPRFAAPAKPAATVAKPNAAQGAIIKPAAVAPIAATAPQPPQPKPERAAGEGLQSFKQRLVAWDTNRMEYEDAVSKAAIRSQNETLRLQAVAARPGLAQMGTGLR